MLNLLIFIAGIVLALLFVIGTHEAAHFGMARLLGIKVLRFSLGFGKTLLSWHDKSGTEYVLALLPLGGYVKMLDESEGAVPPEDLPRAYNRQPFYKKFLVVLAGPAVNLIGAFILYWAIFMIGFVAVKPVIGEITPHSIAAESGLPAKQEIISIDNTPVNTWTNILFHLLRHVGNQDTLRITTKSLKDAQIKEYTLNLANWKMDALTPDPLSSLGMTPYEPPMPLVIGFLAKDSPAEKAGLKLGDKLLAMNKAPITDWKMLIQAIKAQPNATILFSIKRGQKTLDVPVTIGSKRNLLLQSSGYLGMAPSIEWPPNLLKTVQYSPLQALAPAFREMKELAYLNFIVLGKIITGKISVQSLGGPITIFESAGTALNAGLLSFLGFLAFFSVSIGIINLLPIPGLDGGHLLIQIIEGFLGHPLSAAWLNLLFRLGFIFILLIFAQTLINDILRF